MSFKSIASSFAIIAALSASSAVASEIEGHSGKSTYAGAVFVQTNSNTGNQILRFGRKANGSLVALGSTPTEGKGSGGNIDPLGSQNSLLLTQDGGFLLVVNSASGTVSSFSVSGTDLNLVDVKSSGGSAPNALAQWGNLVYVLNVAGDSNVVGFRLEDGRLHPIHNAIGYLSASISGGSSINFTPDGKYLVATERVTGNVDVFPVKADGTLGTAKVTNDAGLFDLTIAASGSLFALQPGTLTITSAVIENGTFTPLQTIPNPDAASCWNVVTPDGKWIYTANTASDTISGFAISGSGNLSNIGATNVAATLTPGTKALDLAVSYDSKYLYSINAAVGSVGIWTINANGTLTAQTFLPIPGAALVGYNGIAAY